MARDTLVSLKADKARLESELAGIKQGFIESVNDYEAGCESGKRDFLKYCGLLVTKPVKVSVAFELNISEGEIEDFMDAYDAAYFDPDSFVETRLQDSFDYFAYEKLSVIEIKK